MRRAMLWWATGLSCAAYLLASVIGVASTRLGPDTWLWLVLGPPPFLLAGLVLFVRRPGHRIGELLLLMALASFVVPQIIEIPVVLRFEARGPESWMGPAIWANQTLGIVGAVLGSLMVALLPDGEVRFSRERRFVSSAWLVALVPTLSLVSNREMLHLAQTFPGVSGVPSPLFVEALEPLGGFLGSLSGLSYGVFVVAVVLLVMRQRHAPDAERRQVRWVLFAGVMAVLAGVVPVLLAAIGVIPPIGHGLAGLLTFLPILLLPASIVAAVMAPPWIDVDLVIRKSFVYGALSFLILLIYIAVSASLGLAAGSVLPIEVAVVLTVVVAAAFQPARRWLQQVADRWVFGIRPTRYDVVTGFGATIETVDEPTELLERLVEAVKGALEAAWVEVRFDEGTMAAAGEREGEPALVVPIRSAGEEVGRIECGGRKGAQFDPDDVRLVHTLASQVGMAVANARLAARIVTAAESERRRIERNIHDGAQQELVALVARLGMARVEAEREKLSPETLAELQAEARRILADLRDLAQGIHPSLLSDAGLLEAVEERCSRLPIAVDLEAAPELRTERFRDDVEGAAYFVITEGITNVLKHSAASTAEVSLRRQDGRLCLSVSDNGRGFDPHAARQQGLAGLRDRISALGGTLEVESTPGSGTRLSASLPVT